MPIFLPFALGGLALTALGLGVKRIVEELSPPFSEGSAGRQAWERHREAVKGLRVARQRVTERARAYGERQGLAWQQTALPFRALLERLERWEHARAAEVLTARGVDALSALPPEPVSSSVRWNWALLGAGHEAPPALVPMLQWLDRGWLEKEGAPVLVEGVSLYLAVACSPSPVDEAAAIRAFDAACAELGRVVAFLEAVHARLEALDARVATLHGRASAQLEYLDAASFEEGRPEPRERLVRLGALMGSLAEALRLPVLEMSGGLAPLSEPLAD
ncbi:hypothetical protein [Hyalangium versicolor]|uniref:hypothetical protein n=1 Tax=Hyalangium versicolor TaxID=2861190 RepID=UPI001CCCB9D7|nr:hypothetical protein [Hyalangium versicolor]